MPKQSFWLASLFTILFVLGINTGELIYLQHLGTTICLSCIGVG